MFKCDFILNNECQLYSKKCIKDKCKYYGACHSCRHKTIGYGLSPCNACSSIKGKPQKS